MELEHSEACRTRITTAMEGDEDGSRMLERDLERTNHWLAEQLEEAVRKEDEEHRQTAAATNQEGIGAKRDGSDEVMGEQEEIKAPRGCLVQVPRPGRQRK